MTLPIGDTVADGVSRLRGPGAVPAFVAAYAVQVLLAVGTQSQLAITRERPEFDLVGESLLPDELPLALDVPLGVAVAAWLCALVASVTVSMAALRIFADEPAVDPTSDAASGGGPAADGGGVDDRGSAGEGSPIESRPRPAPDDGLARATARGIAAGILTAAAVAAGLVVLVVPGLFLAATFALAYPAIALEDRGTFDALVRSNELTGGTRLRVFGLLVAVVLAILALAIAGGLVAVGLSPLPVLAELAALGFNAAAWLFALAVLASGFERLRAARRSEEAKWEGIDDELLP